ncbi:TOMM precursor leader peptide-binding protein [Clostridium saccharoperbutylacetonicum]|uniref:TOMM precursor leader peptide-binding protein n=1 Tax=Clostridium saccharoperbutylacetonicum TaxID=36745 RepID=UPI0039E9C77F
MEIKNNRKYIINKTQKIVSYNQDCAYIKSFNKTYSLKGKYVSVLLNDLVNEFKIPVEINLAIDNLSARYSIISIQNMIDFLIQNKFLVEEYEISEDGKKGELINVINMLSNSGKKPEEIIETLSNCKVGIIASDSIVDDIINPIVESGLLKNLFIANIDNDKYNTKFSDNDNFNINLINYNYNRSEMIKGVIENSNFIIVALDRYNDLILKNVNDECIKNNVDWIKTIIDGGFGEIGPIVRPGKTPCYECYKSRTINNLDDENLIIFKDVLEDESKFNYGYLFPSNKVSASLVLLEAMKAMLEVSCTLEGKILLVNYFTLDFSIHNIVKVHNCPSCS